MLIGVFFERKMGTRFDFENFFFIYKQCKISCPKLLHVR